MLPRTFGSLALIVNTVNYEFVSSTPLSGHFDLVFQYAIQQIVNQPRTQGIGNALGCKPEFGSARRAFFNDFFD